MDWPQVVELLKGAGLAHLSTATPHGQPHVSVVSPAVEGEILWFATTASSRKARNLRANPRLALMWQPQAEIYVSGTATLVGDVTEKRRLWESGLLGFDPAMFWGTPDNPDLVFVRVEPISATVVAIGPNGLARQHWRRSA